MIQRHRPPQLIRVQAIVRIAFALRAVALGCFARKRSLDSETIFALRARVRGMCRVIRTRWRTRPLRVVCRLLFCLLIPKTIAKGNSDENKRCIYEHGKSH